MSLQRAWEFLQAFWPDQAEKPPTGEGQNYLPTLQGSDDVLWRHPSTLGRWEPMVDLTDPDNPGFVHLGNGDILMLWVEG